MKKLLSLIFVFTILLCGCNANNTADSKEPIKINLPKDNTVNGYRIKDNQTEGMPDKISGADVSPNQTVTVKVENNSSKKETASKEQSGSNSKKNADYCGNKNSKKFHKSDCSALKNTKDENKVYFGSKQDFLDNGYVACKMCKP